MMRKSLAILWLLTILPAAVLPGGGVVCLCKYFAGALPTSAEAGVKPCCKKKIEASCPCKSGGNRRGPGWRGAERCGHCVVVPAAENALSDSAANSTSAQAATLVFDCLDDLLFLPFESPEVAPAELGSAPPGDALGAPRSLPLVV